MTPADGRKRMITDTDEHVAADEQPADPGRQPDPQAQA